MMGVTIQKDTLHKRLLRHYNKLQIQQTGTPLEENVMNQSGSEVSSIASRLVLSSLESDETNVATVLKPKAGRPKGLTDQKKRDHAKNKIKLFMLLLMIMLENWQLRKKLVKGAPNDSSKN